MNVRIIGIDCATEPKKMGLALGDYLDGVVTVSEARTGGEGKDAPLAVIQHWIGKATGKVLLAIDAPLGWPIGMRTALMDHTAGAPIAVAPNEMFRRLTDIRMKERLGKTPLDVGADRIARTAHKALWILGELKKSIGEAIPLAWHSSDLPDLSAIEIYPAALLAEFDLDATLYKKPDADARGRLARNLLLERVQKRFESTLSITADKHRAFESADALDAILSVLAGARFLSGNAIEPSTDLERARARTEGWIWAGDKPKSTTGAELSDPQDTIES